MIIIITIKLTLLQFCCYYNHHHLFILLNFFPFNGTISNSSRYGTYVRHGEYVDTKRKSVNLPTTWSQVMNSFHIYTLHTLNPVKTLQLRYTFTEFYISVAYTYSIVHLMILLHSYYETKVNRFSLLCCCFLEITSNSSKCLGH